MTGIRRLVKNNNEGVTSMLQLIVIINDNNYTNDNMQLTKKFLKVS